MCCKDEDKQGGGSTGNRIRAAAWEGLPRPLCAMHVLSSALLALFLCKMNAPYSLL